MRDGAPLPADVQRDDAINLEATMNQPESQTFIPSAHQREQAERLREQAEPPARMTAAEFAAAIRQHAWDWDIFKFAKAIGYDRGGNASRDVWVIEKFRAFKDLAATLAVLGELIEKVAI